MDVSSTAHRFGLVAALIIIAGVAFFFMSSKDNTKKDAKEIGQTVKTEATVALPITGDTKPSLAAKNVTPTGAIIKTNLGDIEVAFFSGDAPKTVENFLKLAETGFYSGTKFHRVIKGFMIQGGDPLSKQDSLMGQWGTGGPGYTFGDEINSHKIVRGALAMANAGPNTNGSQFFIVTAGATPWLDGRHTVFGKVVKGMSIVDNIENTPVGERDIPKTPVVVENITRK